MSGETAKGAENDGSPLTLPARDGTHDGNEAPPPFPRGLKAASPIPTPHDAACVIAERPRGKLDG